MPGKVEVLGCHHPEGHGLDKQQLEFFLSGNNLYTGAQDKIFCHRYKPVVGGKAVEGGVVGIACVTRDGKVACEEESCRFHEYGLDAFR